jgi:hypothetical protein
VGLRSSVPDVCVFFPLLISGFVGRENHRPGSTAEMRGLGGKRHAGVRLDLPRLDIKSAQLPAITAVASGEIFSHLGGPKSDITMDCGPKVSQDRPRRVVTGVATVRYGTMKSPTTALRSRGEGEALWGDDFLLTRRHNAQTIVRPNSATAQESLTQSCLECLERYSCRVGGFRTTVGVGVQGRFKGGLDRIHFGVSEIIKPTGINFWCAEL